MYFRALFDKDINLTFADLAPALTDVIFKLKITFHKYSTKINQIFNSFQILGNLHFKGQVLKVAKINAKYSNQTYFYTFDYRGEHTRFGFGEDTSKYPFDGGKKYFDLR